MPTGWGVSPSSLRLFLLTLIALQPFGPPSGPPMVKPYTFDDLMNALNQVALYDWNGFSAIGFTKSRHVRRWGESNRAAGN